MSSGQLWLRWVRTCVQCTVSCGLWQEWLGQSHKSTSLSPPSQALLTLARALIIIATKNWVTVWQYLYLYYFIGRPLKRLLSTINIHTNANIYVYVFITMVISIYNQNVILKYSPNELEAKYNTATPQKGEKFWKKFIG